MLRGGGAQRELYQGRPELALTQGAVCRQIGSPEAFLNVELFRRSRRGVKLTEAGLSYSRQVAAQLDAVERDTLSVMRQQGANVIELAVVPTFGTQWLLPRLKDFQQRHPEVTVNLTNRTRPFLFADTTFDAAIYFGDADWSGTQSHRLMGKTRYRCAARRCWAGRVRSTRSALHNCHCCSRARAPMPGGSGSAASA